MSKQKLFICPNCKLRLIFENEIEIKQSDVCPKCFYDPNKQKSIPTTCVESSQKSRMILTD